MARWERIRSRGNVEDRRGMSGGRVAGGIGGLGIIGILLALLLGGGGGGLDQILGQLQAQAPQQQSVQAEEFEGEDDYEVFASTVLGSNNDTWEAVFRQNNLEYGDPRLVLFRGQTDSACGGANSAVGPHYCPLDETIYLDETFFDELQRRFGAEGGDVAEAYVIAHEVAHHVQNELNIMDEVQNRQRSASSQQEANQWSVGLELQADCFAGVWANSISDAGVFGPGEINEAIDAAEAVGDDRIQESIQGRVSPESWTHGSSAQRVEWFNRGFNTGDPSLCDTFG
ncbi:MAG: neutral zinc metallopeptidase [Acidimicrobiia bacterium]|nr:neutral zinc metallopeptidase [Acidimicrobiia bacterium]MDH5294112.1 neutral zinc metallopeptidase [Acidimicrobiia bacterium]